MYKGERRAANNGVVIMFMDGDRVPRRLLRRQQLNDCESHDNPFGLVWEDEMTLLLSTLPLAYCHCVSAGASPSYITGLFLAVLLLILEKASIAVFVLLLLLPVLCLSLLLSPHLSSTGTFLLEASALQ